jgi:hypothetical protein
MSDIDPYDPRFDCEPDSIATAIELVASCRRLSPSAWKREALQVQLARDSATPLSIISLLDGEALRSAVQAAAKRQGMSLSAYATIAIRSHIMRDTRAQQFLDVRHAAGRQRADRTRSPPGLYR